MSVFREMTRKPWLEVEGEDIHLHQPAVFVLPAAKVGLRVFLVVVTVIFALTIIAYVDRLTLSNWRPLPEPGILWLNTALLILSSAALEWARVSVRRGHMQGVRNGMHLGGALAIAFLAGQLLAWRELAELGYFAASNTANAFFYLLTALHGLHLLGGLVAWWRGANRMWRGGDAADLRLGIELCAFYWHYLLLIWAILFVLMLNT